MNPPINNININYEGVYLLSLLTSSKLSDKIYKECIWVSILDGRNTINRLLENPSKRLKGRMVTLQKQSFY